MGCICPKKVQGVELDFKCEVKAVEKNMDLHSEVESLLSRKDDVMKAIDEYKGCQELARAAMSKPSQETEIAAFEGLLSAVVSIQKFYDFSKEMEKIFPKLISRLAEGVGADKLCHFEQMPGLTRQLELIFNFTLEFDRLRMLRPNLSNDFSYYRRLLPKFNKHAGIVVKDDEASGMALYTAEHIPMTACLAKAGAKAQELVIIEDGKAAEGKIGLVLATLANSCMLNLRNAKGSNSKDDAIFIARVMTGSAVIFDHVDHAGAFARRSPLAIKPIINMLKKDFASEFCLLNAIRYSTKNFREAPDAIQAMFD